MKLKFTVIIAISDKFDKLIAQLNTIDVRKTRLYI